MLSDNLNLTRRVAGNAKTSLVSAMLNMFFQYSTATQSRYILYDDPEKAKERLVKIDPPATSFFTGAIAPTATVKPAPMKGVWLPSPLAADSPDVRKEKVILHFPGGAFVIAFGHESGGRPASEILTKHLKASKFFWAQYRLAADEETRFPAAIQDAVTYYQYVLSLGVDPKNIIISGDSAGGNVALTLLRYLEQSGQASGLPLPGGAIVFSPWVEVTPKAAQDYEACSNTAADMLTASLLQWGADAYLPKDVNGVEAYLSPVHHPFKTSVPIYIHAGAAEAFCEPIRKFAGEMEQTDGNRVRFYAAPKAPHDILLSHDPFGMTEEFHGTLDEACDFLSGGK